MWHRIEPDIDSLELVRALRATGYGVHSCYSCDLGVAKPAPGFFAAVARRIGAKPSSILFVDDNAGNVEGARAAGLAAEQWDLEQRHDVLLALLASHGVVADLSEPVQ